MHRTFIQRRRKKFFSFLGLGLIAFTLLAPLTFQFSSFSISENAVFAEVEGPKQEEAKAKIDETKKQEAEQTKLNQPKTPATDCNGSGSSMVMCFVTRAIATVLGWIIEILRRLVLLLVKILLAFAKYNGFSTAKPVEMGWKIVRDICNLFFIVIILISAFATILQYDTGSFHYTKVLPKLLLMAILINFSRTLIQLLIDFSQVIMLTFVNAFYQAGAGNFVEGFGLTKYLSVVADSANGTGTAAGQVNVILSYILAIILLIITMGVLIIFIGFIMARIVGLWIALIFSPIALLETAVPHRLQKGMSAFTSKYWSKLSSMLTGGPIIAFFLWLTLATVQQTSGGDGLSGSLGIGLTGGGEPEGFLSGIGNSSGIASFIIAIAMMLMGLDAAQEAASGVSKTLGGWASNVAKKTTGAAAWAAKTLTYRPFTAAAVGIDKRADITGGASRLALKTRIGNVPLVGDKIRKNLIAGVNLRPEQKKKEAAEILKGTENMSHADKVLAAKNIPSSWKTVASPAEKLAYANLMGDLGSDKTVTSQSKAKAKDIEAGLIKGGMSEAQAKQVAEVQGKDQAMQEAGRSLGEAKKMYTAMGNTEKVDEIDKQFLKNPMLAVDPADADRKAEKGILKKVSGDIKKADMSNEAKSSLRVAQGIMEARGITETVGGNVSFKDPAALEKLLTEVKDDKQLTTTIKAAADLVQNRGTDPTTGGPARVERAVFDQGIMRNDADGTSRAYQMSDGAQIKNGRLTQAMSNLRGGANNVANVNEALQAGGEVKDLKGAGTTVSTIQSVTDSAFTNAVSSAGDGSRATSDTDKARHYNNMNNDIQNIQNLVDQFDNLEVPDREQLMASFKPELTENFSRFNNEIKRSLTKMVENLMDQAQVIQKAGGARGNPHKQAIIDHAQALVTKAQGSTDMPKGLKNMILGA